MNNATHETDFSAEYDSGEIFIGRNDSGNEWQCGIVSDSGDNKIRPIMAKTIYAIARAIRQSIHSVGGSPMPAEWVQQIAIGAFKHLEN